ncbi:hypothetical protein ACFW04_012031 [Cataglyphis niger]
MFVNKFGIPLKKHGNDERLRPAIESVRNYVRDNALCASSANEYDARERKIRRLARRRRTPTRRARVEYRENAERIASQLRKDADEAGQGVVLLFARLAQLESALSKRLDTAESAISKIETNVGDLNKRNENLVKEIARNSVKSDTAEHILDKRLDAVWKAISRIESNISAKNVELNKTLQKLDEKSQIATKFIDKIKNLEESTKYAWAVPLKSKSANEITRALSKITRNSKRCPKNLQTDKGKEFYNTEMRKFAKEHGMNHYSTYSVMKASIVERFNRTFKNSMWKYFTLNGTYKWIDALPRLVKEYNARKHRTIGMKPVDVTPAIADKLLNTIYSNVKIAAPAKFKPNDPVRVSKFKTIFEKGFTPNWTTEIFRITKVQQTNPVTYLLKDSRNEPIAEDSTNTSCFASSTPTYIS